MTPAPGDAIGAYTVARELGRGGMGVVFLAEDTRLGRHVAIKSLPEELASDPARLERFEREARILAQLNHPNVAGIHGVEEQGGARYLVLEFVEGETLADLLDKGALAPDEAIELATQIASGVEAAHDAGVIHRDLKPGNIIVTSDGQAKVLDFGLARQNEDQSSGSSEAATLTSPAMQATTPGVILGTAAYMSPEQARGRRVDKRSDIWSFGVILYEMLTGIGPFRGETVTDSIGAILHKDVDLDRLPPATPPRVRRVLTRCLQRDKSKRYRDIGDTRLDLAASSIDAEPASTKAGPGIVPIIAASALLGAAGLVTGLLLASREKPTDATIGPAEVRTSLTFPAPIGNMRDPESPREFALSPSEPIIAYAGWLPDEARSATPGVVIHDFRTGRSRKLEGTDDAWGVQFSPDGKSILWGWDDESSDSFELRRVSVEGGPSLTVIVESPDGTYAMGATSWIDDDTLLVPSQEYDRMYRVSIASGTVEEMGELKGMGQAFAGGAGKLLDERSLLLSTIGLVGSEVRFSTSLIDLETLEVRPFLPRGGNATPIDGNRVVFSRNNTLCVAQYDPETRQLVGAATPVLSGLISDVAFRISKTGDLFVITGDQANACELVAIDRNGRAEPLVPGARPQVGVLQVSEDGGSIGTNVGSLGSNLRAVIFDLTTGAQRPIEPGAPISVFEGFAPDNRAAMIRLFSSNHYELNLIDRDGLRPPIRVLPEPDGAGEQRAANFTSDGRWMLFEYLPNEEGREDGIYAVDLTLPEEQRKAIPIIATEALEGGFILNADNTIAAYQTEISGRSRVIVQRFDPEDPAARQRQVLATPDGGRRMVWSRDGSTLYYLTDNNDLMTIEVSAGEDGIPMVGVPELFARAEDMNMFIEFGYHIFAELPDGRIAYPRAVPRESDSLNYTYTYNWTQSVAGASPGAVVD